MQFRLVGATVVRMAVSPDSVEGLLLGEPRHTIRTHPGLCLHSPLSFPPLLRALALSFKPFAPFCTVSGLQQLRSGRSGQGRELLSFLGASLASPQAQCIPEHFFPPEMLHCCCGPTGPSCICMYAVKSSRLNQRGAASPLPRSAGRPCRMLRQKRETY